MLWGVEGLGLSLGQSLPLLCQRLAGSGGVPLSLEFSPPTWGSGRRNMGVIFLTSVLPSYPFLHLSFYHIHTHFLSLKFPGSSEKQRQHLTCLLSGLRAHSFWSPFLEILGGDRTSLDSVAAQGPSG